eukprot:3418694-Alexandrium_andersonii.AAC.1
MPESKSGRGSRSSREGPRMRTACGGRPSTRRGFDYLNREGGIPPGPLPMTCSGGTQSRLSVFMDRVHAPADGGGS